MDWPDDLAARARSGVLPGVAGARRRADHNPSRDGPEWPLRGVGLSLRERILAVDYGRVRLGLAVSDALGLASHPLPALRRGTKDTDLAALRAVLAERDVRRLVVGLPLNMNGSEGPMAAEARAFGTWLGTATGLPVEYEDERLSTDEAEEFLRSAGLRPSDRKKLRDSVAAAVILRSVLEREPGSGGPG
jgi:putative Holliday junction resolvase